MEFRRLYDGNPCRYYTDPGSRYQIEYTEAVAPDGTHYLEAVGKIDLVALHQQDRDSVDLPAIVSRYQSGDITALDHGAKPLYADVSQIPDDPVLQGQMLTELRHKYGDIQSAITVLEQRLAGDDQSAHSDTSTDTSTDKEVEQLESQQ